MHTRDKVMRAFIDLQRQDWGHATGVAAAGSTLLLNLQIAPCAVPLAAHGIGILLLTTGCAWMLAQRLQWW